MLQASQHRETLTASAEEIFSHYGCPIEFGRHIRCPHRKDKSPSCGFWQSKTGKIYLHDFATGDLYDSISFVMKLFGLPYLEARKKIIAESVEFKKIEKVTPKTSFDITVVEDKLEDYMSYWNSFYIPIDIVSKYATVARSVYVNETFRSRSTKANPIFVYRFPSGHQKLYRPLSPDLDKKWGGNSDMHDIGGLAQLPRKGKLCIVTSSIKDVMVLRQHGFPAICFNGEGYGTQATSESGKIVKQIITALKTRYTHVVLFLDNDVPGRLASNKIAQINGLPEIFLHGKKKDISDYQKKYKPHKTFKKLKKQLAKAWKL